MVTKKSYSSSPTKVVFISSVIFTAICLVFTPSKGKFDLTGLGLGATFGLLFALFPLVYGFGQKIKFTESEISYSSSLLACCISKFKKKLLISQIREVRLGTPKFSKYQATFAAINISSENDEITFNPDLFNNDTVQNLFQELKTRNPNIKFDNYSLNFIEKGKNGGVSTKMVFSNFLWTILLIIFVGITSLVLFKLDIIPNELIYVVAGAQIVIVPFIYNWLVQIFRKRKA